MRLWHGIGVLLRPAKIAVFWLLSRVHKTTRPRVAIICGGEVLLVRNWGDRDWALPGGGAHRNEDPKQAAVREIYEELGVNFRPSDLSYIETVDLGTYYAPLYVAKRDKKPTLKVQAMEITAVKWCTKATAPAYLRLLEKLEF